MSTELMLRFAGWKHRWTGFARWHPPEEALLLVTAVVVGIGTGLGAVFFIWLIARMTDVRHTIESSFGVGGFLALMALAGLFVGLMVSRWAKEAKGHGVPEVMEAVAVRGGFIRPRVALVKILASGLTIGAGGSAGREGPIVQSGAALGSTIGQFLHFGSERMQTLVAAGSAAGIAATFNAPIAGSIFALEVILGRFSPRHFSAVVLSAVSASIVSRMFLGDQPAFAVPAYPFHHIGELPIYLVLGVLAACVAVLFIRILYAVERQFDAWSMAMPVKTACGMLLTGLIALLLPRREVLGPGLHTIGETIADNMNLSLTMLALLLGLKLLATSCTLGSGNSGGVFSPSLFMGAALGGIVGQIGHSLWPTVAINPGAYAIVGMAATFAGAARAPITAIMIVFEMSNDYQLILPLMLATGIATLSAEALFEESIYTYKLKLKGITLQAGRDVGTLQAVTIGQVMSRDFGAVSSQTTVAELTDYFRRTRRHGALVLDDRGRLWGLVTMSDLHRAMQEGLAPTMPVTAIGTPYAQLVVAYPDETLAEVTARMGVHGYEYAPVVSRENPMEIVGDIHREAMTKAYDAALAQRAGTASSGEGARLDNAHAVERIELIIREGDPVVGKSPAEVGALLPPNSAVLAIRRNGRSLHPHDTIALMPGDRITVSARARDIDRIRKSLCGPRAIRLSPEGDGEIG
ncbi:MAG: CBS domain-containing protein [Nitrospirae bacterium]|nr:MAG: CBS domain-containing protein [Nitrospirota bacterium]